MTCRACQLLLLAAFSTFAASAQSTGSVQGRVLSALHGEPVANAQVTLREVAASGGAAPQIYMCQTGADGAFSINGIMPGVYDPRPNKQGFETRPNNRVAGTHEYPPVTVEAGKPVTGLELRLIPDSVISGRILDPDGDPVRHAEVQAQQYAYVAGKRKLETAREAQTNDRGEYRIFYLPPGRYYVQAAVTGASISGRPRNGTLAQPIALLGKTYYPGVTDAARASDLQAQPGAEVDGIDIHLMPEKGYSIRGKLPIGDSMGRGVYIVNRSGDNIRQPLSSINSTRDGYEISDIAPGNYLVIGDSVSKSNPSQRLYARRMVEVTDHNVDDADLSYSPGVQVNGTVKLQGAAAVDFEKTPLLLRNEEVAGAQEQAKIAPDGKFTSPELPPGVYQVAVPGGNAYVASVRLGDRELPGASIDTERLSGDLTVLISADFGQVEGTVTDEAGKPVYDANVTLIPDQSGADWQDRFRNAFTLADGKFTLKNIRPGEYRVFAWLGAESGAPQSADFRKPYEERGVKIKVEANAPNSVELKAIIPAPEQ